MHFAVSREYAVGEVHWFNVYFDGLPTEKQQFYYGGKKSSVVQYERCFFCNGPHTNFRESVEGDCPDGCTTQPIIHE